VDKEFFQAARKIHPSSSQQKPSFSRALRLGIGDCHQASVALRDDAPGYSIERPYAQEPPGILKKGWWIDSESVKEKVITIAKFQIGALTNAKRRLQRAEPL
jgi:hypothetical protein